MKISELKAHNVTVLIDNNPVYYVRCDVCLNEWQLLLTTKGTIRRGEWKCIMCDPPKHWIKLAKELEEE